MIKSLMNTFNEAVRAVFIPIRQVCESLTNMLNSGLEQDQAFAYATTGPNSSSEHNTPGGGMG